MKKKLDEQIWTARVVVYILAFLEIGFSLIFQFMSQSDSYYSLLVAVLFAVIFVILGVWSKAKPFPALFIVTILFLVDSLIFFLFHPLSLMGIAIRTAILVFLIRGVNAALEMQEIKKKEASK